MIYERFKNIVTERPDVEHNGEADSPDSRRRIRGDGPKRYQFNTINKAKRWCRSYQMQVDGALGLGSVRVRR